MFGSYHVLVIRQPQEWVNDLLARVGGAEGYVFSVRIGTLIELPTDVKLYKDQNKRQAFPKTFRLQSYDCRFTTFRRLLVAKEYMETQLILFV